ncbi:(deoxy)nucleoside triphosphate pyrophosphohydrolase [Lentibacillus saliphilus]|uniref:(deoxy)nucleoside triphosphate pyrophosphohydrolase n=1 Tax=Lentibacillus saliphilus TaxID=2737028 RepID=UPI001FE6C135|nr:(deoxy)nucleoside triphosphate pyrophosphohydrolase [Lentibacillus saliphilus]
MAIKARIRHTSKEMVTVKQIDVVGAVIVRDNQILCAQRGSTQILPHLWEFPGGKIEADEMAEQALKREIREELECDINVGKQVAHTIHQYDFATVRLTTFYCELAGADEPKRTEHDTLKWVHPHEMMNLNWAPADIPAVKRIMDDFEHKR